MRARALFKGRKGDSPITKNLIYLIIGIIVLVALFFIVRDIVAKMLVIES